MSGFGGFGRFPFAFGGDPGPEEKIYDALRGALLPAGMAAEDSYEVATFDGLWRAARAAGLAALEDVDEAAHWQAFPQTASDEVPSYEEVLGIVPSPQLSLAERARDVTELWTSKAGASFSELGAALELLDTRFSFIHAGYANSGYVVPGKVYGVLGEADIGTFDGLLSCSLWPNFSDDYVVKVLYDIGTGSAVAGETGRVYSQAYKILDDALPAWNDFQITFGSGFILDTSRLDVTGLTE